MKLANPFLTHLGAFLAASTARRWMASLDYRVAYFDPAIDPARRDCQGRKIYIFWHEYILLPIYLRGHCNLAMLLSRHRDAEILSRVAYHLGFECVRGSTYRGGGTAIRQLLRRSRHMHLTITPDGPRGPRRRLAQGPIYLASKLRVPLVAMGFGYDRPWRVSSWDRFAIPRPLSRARAVVSPEIFVPAGLDRAGVEQWRQHVERVLNRLTDSAEQWAASGQRWAVERPLTKQTAPLPFRRRRAPDHNDAVPLSSPSRRDGWRNAA